MVQRGFRARTETYQLLVIITQTKHLTAPGGKNLAGVRNMEIAVGNPESCVMMMRVESRVPSSSIHPILFWASASKLDFSYKNQSLNNQTWFVESGPCQTAPLFPQHTTKIQFINPHTPFHAHCMRRMQRERDRPPTACCASASASALKPCVQAAAAAA